MPMITGMPTAIAMFTATAMAANTATSILTSTNMPTSINTLILTSTPPGAGTPITIMSTMTSATRSNRMTTAIQPTPSMTASQGSRTTGITMAKTLKSLALTVAAAALLSACAGGEPPPATGGNGVNAAAGALPPAQAAKMPTARPASQVAAQPQDPAKTEQAKTDTKAGQAVAAAPAQESERKPTEVIPQPDLGEGLFSTYEVKKGDDLLEIARAKSLGYLELKAANPEVDPWLPIPGHKIRIPSVHLLAAKIDTGVMINLAQMRLYRFEKGAMVDTYPLGIGREGLETPVGTTTVLRKTKDPSWYPTARMRREKPELPAVVGPGPDNPLGNRAIYLGWDLYRIHGTNIPWGVGRRTSSGCLRMYPENVEALYEHVNAGTNVKVVNDRVIVEWREGRLWLEAHPTNEGWDALEYNEPMPDMPLTTDMVAMITHAVPDGTKIDWNKVNKAVKELRGYPVPVT